MEAEIISGHLHAVSNETILKKDIGTVGIMSVILFSLLFVLFYRCDFRSLAIPVLPVLASLIVLGAMTLIFRECLFFIVGMGGVVISLAVDYGIHTYAAVRSSRSPCRKLARLAPAIFAGAVTSALAFGLFLFSRISACRFLCRDKSASQFFPDAVAASFASGKTQENPGDHETFPFSRPPSGNLYGRMDSCFHFFLFHSWKTGVSDGYPPV